MWRCWFLSIILYQKEPGGFLQKWLIPGSAQGKFQGRLEYVGVPESKDVPQTMGTGESTQELASRGLNNLNCLSNLNINEDYEDSGI